MQENSLNTNEVIIHNLTAMTERTAVFSHRSRLHYHPLPFYAELFHRCKLFVMLHHEERTEFQVTGVVLMVVTRISHCIKQEWAIHFSKGPREKLGWCR